MNTTSPILRARLLVLPIALALASCTPGKAVFIRNEPSPTTRWGASLQPGARADIYLAHDNQLEGIDTRLLRPGRPATETALAGHANVVGAQDLARLGDNLLVTIKVGTVTPGTPSAGHATAAADADSVMLVNPATGAIVGSLTLTAATLRQPTITSLILDETSAAPDRSVAYVAGRFGRPGDPTFHGFVVRFDTDLTIASPVTFDHDVVQDLSADEHGAVALLSDGSVVDADTGATLRRPDYDHAADAISVRRNKDGLWIGVAPSGPADAFLVTPRGRVDLPSRDAVPSELLALRDGVAALCPNVVYILKGTTLQAVAVPHSAASAVLIHDTLYVLSAGSDRITGIHIPSLHTTNYLVPAVSALIL